MATYVIGDIHGCMSSLERLLAVVAFAPAQDRLWLVGDLVNRGPRSLDVLRWARDLGSTVTCVLGNHDLHLLARAAGVAREKKRDTLDHVLDAHDLDRLMDWLRTQPLFHVEGDVAMVHAGLHPAWTIDDAKALAGEIERELRAPTWRSFLAQLHGPSALGGKVKGLDRGSRATGPSTARDPGPSALGGKVEGLDRGSRATGPSTARDPGPSPRWDARLGGGDRWRAILAYLTRARTLKTDGRVESDFDGKPSDAPAGCVPWFAFPGTAWTTHTVLFGHWASLGLDLGPHHGALDTGCVWGHSLTAMRLDDRMVFQVESVEVAS